MADNKNLLNDESMEEVTGGALAIHMKKIPARPQSDTKGEPQHSSLLDGLDLIGSMGEKHINGTQI